MATDALSYTGINRAYSDYAGTHACEELINLRPATEGLVPVKEAVELMSNVPYYKVFVHHTTSGPKYIAIGRNLADVYAKYLEYDEENETWVEKKTLFSISAPNPIAARDLLDRVYYASAGNVLAFSICDTENGVFENRAFTWKWSDRASYEGGQWVAGETYVQMDGDAPGVTFTVKDDNTDAGAESDVSFIVQGIAHIDESSTITECTEAVANGLNAIQEENPDLCFGPVIIAIAFKTADGKTSWSGKWQVYDPIPTVMRDPETNYVTREPYFTADVYKPFFDKYGYGYLCGHTAPEDEMLGYLDKMAAGGTRVRLEFDQLSPGSWDNEASIIQSVEVYASRPQCYLDTERVEPRVGFVQIVDPGEAPSGQKDYFLFLPQKKYQDMDLGGQLLYYQASIQVSSLMDGDVTVDLTFGGNVQMTEDTLDTDAGALKRYGRLLSYNARFHYYDSVSHIDVGMPTFNFPPRTIPASVTGDIFVRYADNDQSELMYLGTQSIDPLFSAYAVVAPSLNIKEVITYARNTSDNKYYIHRYRMTASSSYNFTICTDLGTLDTPSSSPNAELEAAKLNQGTVVSNVETDAINVSEQYNPFVFLVEHSYKAPGNILDVQTQMAGITDTSYGRDPLNVFTERGTYALTQGSANVLYGAFLPVSNSVISRSGGFGSLPTEMGVFFLADGALWLLSGRRATLVSDALHLGPHRYIRDCEGYQRISGGGSVATPEYDVANLVSSSTFEEYVRSGGRLGFNRFRMELYVSNKAYPYTYVLSLKYRQWFKLGKCLWQDDPSGELISTNGEGGHGLMTILDLSAETDGDVLVHLQTRPFSMGYRYIHMHRIVSMVRARLSAIAGEKLVVGLYGSDNLQDWKLLAYAKRTGTDSQTDDDPPVVTGKPLKISQIRTSSSARSWRYYTVCIGGTVPTDTDLGPVLVDYQPVIRRIG